MQMFRNRNQVRIVLIFLALTGCLSISYAQISAINRDLLSSIQESQYISVCRVKNYVSSMGALPVERLLSARRQRSRLYTGVNSESVTFDVQFPGDYTFQQTRQIKGRAPSEIRFKLGYLLPSYYGDEYVTTEKTNTFLLLMKSLPGQSNLFHPDVELIPLARDIKLSNGMIKRDLQDSVVDLLMQSLYDPAVRAADLKILSSVSSPGIVVAAAHYIDDANPSVRDGALTCLIKNQQVNVIPRIAALSVFRGPFGQRYQAAEMALRSLTVPEATPYLNPLLFSPDASLRFYVVPTLSNLADKSSIPYLMLALRDPQGFSVTNFAWYTLRGLMHFPRANWPTSNDDFLRNYPRYTALCNDWWSDELQGKHLTPEQQVIPQEKRAALKSVAGLNKTLFEPYPSLREQTIDLLAKQADRSSIPFLVLGLQDPDTKVAYGAYRIAARLTKVTLPTVDAAGYAANREAANAPVYAWWADELNAKHVPPPTRGAGANP
jgi:hypothetical protein